MSPEHGDDRFPEQDEQGGDDLPTYDELAQQAGPNSRFGRWQNWIEKRARERYVDITPEERRRRRERGWGNDMLEAEPETPKTYVSEDSATPIIQQKQPSYGLQVNTSFTTAPPEYPPDTPSPVYPTLSGKVLSPTRLCLNHFGSRFLPHSTSQIHCLLPLLDNEILLIGHDSGLSVLDMFPKEWKDNGQLVTKDPADAQARCIWQGAGVFQMSLLEVEDTGGSTPQGVALMLVGQKSETPSSKDSEPVRSLRMYNLASLVSLIKWTISRKDAHPLDLNRLSQSQQTPTKKHRAQGSTIKSNKSGADSRTPLTGYYPGDTTSSSPQNIYPSGNMQAGSSRLESKRRGEDSPDSPWEMIDELPMRWASDSIPLAAPGSKLANATIISYSLKLGDKRPGRGGAMLAIATKSSIFLYETPRGERAFRFVKEFYTPFHPRSMVFIEQMVQDMSRRQTDNVAPQLRNGFHARTVSADDTLVGSQDRRTSKLVNPNSKLGYGSQPTLFVTFHKKAVAIRLADSAVGEVDLFDEYSYNKRRESLSVAPSYRSRVSMDGGLLKDLSRGFWISPSSINLPATSGSSSRPFDTSRVVYILTRGKNTHIVQSPLPASISTTPPLQELTWQYVPSHVTPRVCWRSAEGHTPFLQLVAMGEDGIEVQEISLNFLAARGKSRAEEPVRSTEDLGGPADFLCTGGYWHHLYEDADEDQSVDSHTENESSSSESTGLHPRSWTGEGMYGWYQKGFADFRVFWTGGSGTVQSNVNV